MSVSLNKLIVHINFIHSVKKSVLLSYGLMHYCAQEVPDVFNSIDLKNNNIYFTPGGNTIHVISVRFQFANSSFDFQEICNFESVSVRPGTVMKSLVCTWGKMFRGSCK